MFLSGGLDSSAIVAFAREHSPGIHCFTIDSAGGQEEGTTDDLPYARRVAKHLGVPLDNDDWQRLGHGYRVEARFVIWEDDVLLQVPASSLFRLHDGWALFVAENGRARQRVVEIGQRTGLVAQILEGVTEGNKVVNHPSDEVADGVRITER